MHHLDELFEHLLGNREVGNNAIFHGANGFNIARNTPKHGFSFSAYCQDGFFAIGAAFLANCNHRGLIKHNTPIAHVN